MALADTGYRPCCTLRKLAYHECKVKRCAGHGAADAHDELDVRRLRDSPLVYIVHYAVDMTGIKYFEFRFDVVFNNFLSKLVQETG